MYSFLFALLGGAFVFGNLVRLLNKPLPLRKDPVDKWNWLYATIYWPMYVGVIFPNLSAGLLFLLSAQFKAAGRAAFRMLAGVFIWNPTRLVKQVLTLACWLLWGYWMARNIPIKPEIFWSIFAIGSIAWLFIGPLLLCLLLYLAYEIKPALRLSHR